MVFHANHSFVSGLSQFELQYLYVSISGCTEKVGYSLLIVQCFQHDVIIITICCLHVIASEASPHEFALLDFIITTCSCSDTICDHIC